MKASGRYRKFFLTWNESDLFGPSHDEIKSILSGINKICYWCMCDEVDKTYGNWHTHLFILFDIPVTEDFIAGKFPNADILYLLPSLNECMDYMRKQGKYCNLNRFEENLSDTFEDSVSCPEDVNQDDRPECISGIFEILHGKVNGLWEKWKQRKQHTSGKKKK